MKQTKKQLMNKIKELEKEKEKQLNNHTKSYIHIPKLSLLPLLGIIIFGFLSYINLKLIDWELIKVVFSSEETIKNYSFQLINLINIYPLIGEYILISLTIISLVALFKGGYNKLKSYEEEGLIPGLFGGLIFGLIFELIFGLIFGLIAGLITGLIPGLIPGLIFGLIIGLIGGLIFGLIPGLIPGLIFGLIIGLFSGLFSGLIEEFKN